MEFVIDLAILIVVCGIALLLWRTRLRICPHCSSLFVDRQVSSVQPSYARAPRQHEPSPFVDLPFVTAPKSVQETPVASTPSASGITPPVTTESTDDYSVIETHEPAEMPTIPASALTTPPEPLDSGEILIEPEAEDEHDLLPETDEPRTLRESGELMLEQEIGLGPYGLRLASRLIDAGFGVTTTSEKWGGGGRHRQTSHEIDES
ncbi:hypothetical protein C2W62_03110 [Candidatus Entotheonella serta]|nr:hypothetical protein C2W62_03110 [Candidatus Entotheonella serta]